jgi:hypothetical protein
MLPKGITQEIAKIKKIKKLANYIVPSHPSLWSFSGLLLTAERQTQFFSFYTIFLIHVSYNISNYMMITIESQQCLLI